MIWVSDMVLEFVDTNGKVFRYDFSQTPPMLISVPATRADPVSLASLQFSQSSIFSMTKDKRWTLIQSRPSKESDISREAVLALYDTVNRKVEHLERFPNSGIYAALLSYDTKSSLVEIIEEEGRPANYQVSICDTISDIMPHSAVRSGYPH